MPLIFVYIHVPLTFLKAVAYIITCVICYTQTPDETDQHQKLSVGKII